MIKDMRPPRHSYFSRHACEICKQPATMYRAYSKHKNYMLCDKRKCAFKTEIFAGVFQILGFGEKIK